MQREWKSAAIMPVGFGGEFSYINDPCPVADRSMLNQTHHTLPATWYYDPIQFHREMECIWWKEWLCVARTSELPGPGSYRVVHVGTQQVIITRNGQGEFRAFHNTCRHRGSLLCEQAAGQFDGERIVCPYHAWTYSLDGDLLRTPRKMDGADFRPESYSLYPVALDTWGGYVFINLAERPQQDLQQALAGEIQTLANWPMAELGLAHREIHTIECNWKIFWENFLECYHCPNIHHDLCRLVPLYGQGLSSVDDLPPGSAAPTQANGSLLAPGAVTWTRGGQTSLPWFEGLSEREQTVGMTFASVLPGVFIVAHVDYVRSVHVMPLGPERTQLTVNWMLLPQTLASAAVDIPALIALGNQVVQEDARVCELNQKGLRSLRHQSGVLVPQEYDVLAFDNWVRQRLVAAENQVNEAC
jgi:Rieske 2Fe-2S family protein